MKELRRSYAVVLYVLCARVTGSCHIVGYPRMWQNDQEKSNPLYCSCNFKLNLLMIFMCFFFCCFLCHPAGSSSRFFLSEKHKINLVWPIIYYLLSKRNIFRGVGKLCFLDHFSVRLSRTC